MSKKKKKPIKPLEKPEVVATYEVLRVDWFDHVSGNKSWHIKEELDHSTPICTTVGIKVYEDKKVITLAQNVSTLQHIADTTTIIKSCIDDRIKLGEVRYVKKG